MDVNSHGFRDADYSPAKLQEAFRIVVLGDSITFGNNLPIQETYPKVLEASLRDSEKLIEVLKLGVGGYDTLQGAAL